MNLLIFGSGSSASRFIGILKELGHSVWVYKHRPNVLIPEGCSSLDSLENLSQFDGAIVSSPSATHLEYAKQCVKQSVPALVDKPFSDSLSGVASVVKLARRKNVFLMTGFNLRFLPIVKKIKEYCHSEKLGATLHAELYVGQYLPSWRPWLDYRKNYSAHYRLGGGVALDLIHEIDLALEFFPGISFSLLRSAKLSALDIDTEDFVLFETKSAPIIQVKLDYLNHIKTRQYRIVGTNGSLSIDIFNKRFQYSSVNGETDVVTEPSAFDISASFTEQTAYFLSALSKSNHDITERSLGLDALRVVLKGRKHVQG